jgi:uncharacterized membrane protein YphA (DoxX/SURF4 family)
MLASTRNSGLGRHLFGLASSLTGLVMLLWHNYADHPQLRSIIYAAAAAQILGGLLVQFPRIAKIGAAILTAAYLVFALFCLPQIVTAPRTYNSWGNFFEQFSLVIGAALAFATSPPARSSLTRSSPAGPSKALRHAGRILFGLCVASFALEQAFYLAATASLVPKWVPPNPRFWAIATTVFFALAAIALLTNRMALPAARLLTVMIVGFGLLVWVPQVISDRHSQANWSEFAETFAIAASAWLLATLLADREL